MFTFFQAPAAPTLSFCPRASSSRRRGIPTTTSISRKGRISVMADLADTDIAQEMRQEYKSQDLTFCYKSLIWYLYCQTVCPRIIDFEIPIRNSNTRLDLNFKTHSFCASYDLFGRQQHHHPINIERRSRDVTSGNEYEDTILIQF